MRHYGGCHHLGCHRPSTTISHHRSLLRSLLLLCMPPVQPCQGNILTGQGWCEKGFSSRSLCAAKENYSIPLQATGQPLANLSVTFLLQVALSATPRGQSCKMPLGTNL